MSGLDMGRMPTKNCVGPLEEWAHALVEKMRSNGDPVEPIIRLVRYLSPQVATAVLNSNNEDLFKIHRREITAVFLDLRGFTSFSDSAEPEEVAALLRSYHSEMGRIIFSLKVPSNTSLGTVLWSFLTTPCPLTIIRKGRFEWPWKFVKR